VESRTRRARRSRLLSAILAVLSPIVRRLPLSAVRAAGAVLGHLAFHLDRRDRRIALQNLAFAFPDWDARRRKATVRRMAHHLGTSLMEILWMPQLDAATLRRTTAIEGEEHLARARAAGNGVLIFTGHCGNWEWLAAAVALLGCPLTVLQRERHEPQLNRFITKLRSGFGIRTIDRGSTAAAREMFRAIRAGQPLAFLIDQNIQAESVKVPFFGRPARTPIGPARLAVRAAAPVIACFIERRGGKQIVHFEEPRFLTRDSDPAEVTAWLTASIERQIRRVPEQWPWFHRRWRDRADAPPAARQPPPATSGTDSGR